MVFVYKTVLWSD